MTDQVAADLNDEFLTTVHRIREEMGGLSRIEALHRAGKPTARERMDDFLDPGSFREIGTFARSDQAKEPRRPPGTESWSGGAWSRDGR